MALFGVLMKFGAEKRLVEVLLRSFVASSLRAVKSGVGTQGVGII
jgi:hypothetical protein